MVTWPQSVFPQIFINCSAGLNMHVCSQILWRLSLWEVQLNTPLSRECGLDLSGSDPTKWKGKSSHFPLEKPGLRHLCHGHRIYITYLCIPRYWWEEEGPSPLPYSSLKPWSQPLRREHETWPEGHSTGPSDPCFLRLSSRCSSISVASYNVNFLALISKVLTLGEVYENSLYYCCHFSRNLKACQSVT